MEIRLLEYFLAVCEELHYTRAAEKLGISQPTLSQQIRILEARLGAKLFQQIGKKTYLTEAGKVLKERAHNVFYELDQVTKEINEINELRRGSITISSSGSQLVYSSIVSFHQEYPDINTSVVDTTTKGTIENLLTSTCDIGVVFLPIHNDKLISHYLFTSKLYLVSSTDNELANLSSISLRDLNQQRVFLLQKNFFIRQVIDQYCKESGIDLTPNVELSDMHSLLEITANNNGVTILPKMHVEQMNHSKICTIPITDPLPERDVGIVYRMNSYLSTALRAFIHHLFQNYNVKGKNL
ncbi:LysR family transcriptional regulator [Virgibacillus ainsalahensis]